MGFTLTDNQTDCITPEPPVFTYTVLSEGILKLDSYYPTIYNLSWNMGDGTTYTEKYENIYHKYATGGTYNVCLTRTNDNGSNTTCQSVLIPQWSDIISGKNIKPTTTSTNGLIVDKICECGGNTFMMAHYDYSPVKLYKFDTSTEQVTLLPIDEIGGNQYAYSTECFNNKLYFSGKFGNSGYELCESDGTSTGTKITQNYVSFTNKGVNPNNFRVYNATLYFDGYEESEFSSSQYCFKFQGSNIEKITSLGIHGFGQSVIFNNQLLHAFYRLAMFDGNQLTYLLPENTFATMYGELNGAIIFALYKNSSDTELWRTDGTVNGTYILKDIRPGTAKAIENYWNIKHNNKIYFVANDGINGNELWVTDGTEAGIMQLKNIIAGNISDNISDFKIFNDKVYFVASDGNGYKLWETDGTPSGTKKALGINSTVNIERNLSWQNIFVDNEAIFFTTYNNLTGRFDLNYISVDNTVGRISSNCDVDEYRHYASWKLNNGKLYINGYKNYTTQTLSTCSFSFPNISDRIVYYGDQINLNAPANSTTKWYSTNLCTPISTLSTYTINNSTQSGSIFTKATDNLGCSSNMKKVNIYNYGAGRAYAPNVAKCDASTIRIKVKKSGFFRPENSFKIVLSSNTPSYFSEIPTQTVGDEIIGTIPNEVQNSTTLVAYLKSTAPNITFYDAYIIVPNVYDSKAAYILGNNTIPQGGSSNISILMGGNPPYNFTFNGQVFNGITKNPFFFNVSPTVNTNYMLSDFQNSCGNGNVIIDVTSINISQCLNNISQTGVLSSGIYKAINAIESNGILESPKNMIYESEKRILLNPGFSAQAGTIFSAKIKACQ
jgi:ELWxxDGT repeat protein